MKIVKPPPSKTNGKITVNFNLSSSMVSQIHVSGNSFRILGGLCTTSGDRLMGLGVDTIIPPNEKCCGRIAVANNAIGPRYSIEIQRKTLKTPPSTLLNNFMNTRMSVSKKSGFTNSKDKTPAIILLPN